MTTYVPAKKSAEFIFYAGLVSQSTGQFQVNPTIAAGDFKVSIDGGALANLATLPAVTPAGSRMVKFTLSTSEMNGDNITVVGVDAAGSEWDEVIVSIQTSVQQIDDLATQASVNTIDDFLDTEITDIRNRLPAALVGGRMDSSVGAMAADTLTASALAADAVTEIQSGLSTLTAAGVRSAVGLASANLDTQLDTLPTAAENADAVWDELKSGHTVADSFGDYLDDEITSRATAADIPSAATIADAVLDEDMTAHQTQGSLGQAIGDPVADTNTIYKAVVTDALAATVGADTALIRTKTDNLPADPADESNILGAIAQVQADTDNIQSRLPLTLSGDGFMQSDLKSIEDELTSGNNATLNLKKLSVVNSAGDGVYIQGSLRGINVTADNDALLLNSNNNNGIRITAADVGLRIYGINSAEYLVSDGETVYIDTNNPNYNTVTIASYGTGKSVSATNDIAVSDGDLTLTNIAKKVLTLDWTTVTGEAARSVLNALRKLRNKVSFNGTNTLTIYKEDGTTSAYTQSVSTDDTQDPFKELGN